MMYAIQIYNASYHMYIIHHVYITCMTCIYSSIYMHIICVYIYIHMLAGQINPILHCIRFYICTNL